MLRFLSKYLLTATFTLSFCPIVMADSLDDILSSPLLNQNPHAQNKNDPGSEHFDWFEDKHNLEKVFNSTQKGALFLLDWLGEISLPDISLKSKVVTKKNEFVIVDAVYMINNKVKIDMAVLVPHPKHIELVKSNLVPRFAEIQPPKLPVLAIEKMELRKNECFLYHRKDHSCSILFPLPGNAFLNLATASCDNDRDLVRIAELLSVDRLKQKLQS